MKAYPITPVPKQTEAEVTKSIRSFLHRANIWHFKHWSGRFSRHGISDILGIYRKQNCCPGCGAVTIGPIPIAIEVKKSSWRPPTATNRKAFKAHCEQVAFINEIRENRGIAFFARSVDDVVDGLGARDRFSGSKKEGK